MTREELAEALARLKQASNERITIVRLVTDRHGNPLRRIVRGTFAFKDANGRRPDG
jgi:hypothetical protein